MTDFLEAIQQNVAGHSLSAMLEAANIRIDGDFIVWHSQSDEDVDLLIQWLKAAGYDCFGFDEDDVETKKPIWSVGLYADDMHALVELLGAVRAILARIYLEDIMAAPDFPGNAENPID